MIAAKSPYQRILVTGAHGFLGSHIAPALREALNAEIIPVGRKDYDLLDLDRVEAMFREHKPDAVVHLAGKVGGIVSNKKYPADFFFENVVINTHVLDASHRAGVKRFVTMVGGCSYPAKAASPIGEDQMWNGLPQSESSPYAVAKKMVLVQAEAYRKQFDFNAVVLIPGNVYGEYDNFNAEYSHVIPAMIRRFLEAREKNVPSVPCYGSGRPTRDFVYAGDVAKLVPWFLLHYEGTEPVNISSGSRTPIRELAETIKHVTGYGGQIEWDTSKPDGQMDKIFAVERLQKLGLSCDTPLGVGLQRTMDWFFKARSEGTVRL